MVPLLCMQCGMWKRLSSCLRKCTECSLSWSGMGIGETNVHSVLPKTSVMPAEPQLLGRTKDHWRKGCEPMHYTRLLYGSVCLRHSQSSGMTSRGSLISQIGGLLAARKRRQ